MKNPILKTQGRRSFLYIIVAGFFTLSSASYAAIHVDNFQLSQNSVAFDISGTLPAQPPASSQFALVFSNPSILEYPGFALGDFIGSTAVSFSGSQFVERVSPGGAEYGDYFYVFFATDSSGTTRSLLPGEAIAGSLMAEWSQPVFDPSAVSQLDVFWGSDGSSSLANTGVLLTTVQVPEPDVLYLLCLGLLIAVGRRADSTTIRAWLKRAKVVS